MEKHTAIISLSAVGAVVSTFMGTLSLFLKFLLILMLIDYITGLIVGAAGLSTKSANGRLSSKAGFQGLTRKFMILIWVLIGFYADTVFGWEMFQNMVIFAFMANELISITENSIVLGVPVPPAIAKLIGAIKERSTPDA